ncbi:hypothetical protein [Deinococcus murrayi]|uniref:hypothetical protein n=1 Tax=Deinococcus murrayi TaxID=68910 RepID=UPI000A493728|nr:hypothetical protein [Deinococcus murrayi]
MEYIHVPFSEKLKVSTKDRRLFYAIPDELQEIFTTVIDFGEKIYINDDSTKHIRVCKQALIKVYQDFKIAKAILRDGYQTQASTITSSMLETVYFISYIGYKPDKADEWLTHDEHKWSDGFNNWMTSTLSHMVKNGEMTKELRQDWELTERETYSILCASKHSNGFSIRKTNVVMEEEGKPYLISEPRYTIFSRSECSHTMALAIRIAAQGIGAYLGAIYPDRTYRAFTAAQALGEEALRIGLEISHECSSVLEQEKTGIVTPKTTYLFGKIKM